MTWRAVPAPDGRAMTRSTRPLRCPCCNKPITPEPVKVCADCGRPILRGHKYRMVGGKLRHRHCRFPDSYLTPSELDAKYGVGTWARMHPERRRRT